MIGSAFTGGASWVVDVNHALLDPASRWVDKFGREAHITSRDILVVAPLNARSGAWPKDFRHEESRWERLIISIQS